MKENDEQGETDTVSPRTGVRFSSSPLPLPFPSPLLTIPAPTTFPSSSTVLVMILSIIIQIHFLVLLFALCLYIYLPAPTITDQHGYEPHCIDLYIRILLVLFVYIVFSLFLLSRSFTLSLTNVYSLFYLK